MPLDHPSPVSSIDPEEVAYYQRLADTWWDQTGPFWPLHRLNALRVEWLREQLSALFERDPEAVEPLAGLRILDIGCGGGILSESMARLGAVVQGVDVVEKNIRIAGLHAERSGLDIRYATVSAEQLAEQGLQYDVVLNMEVVEHVADLGGFMHACNRLVRPGGVHCIATINRNPLAGFVAIFGAEYVLGWLPKGTHRYRKLRRPAELRALLRAAGFREVAKSGVRVNPINRRMNLTRFMGINYMLMARKS